MRKSLIFMLIALFAVPFISIADTGTLDSPLTLQPQDAVTIEWDFNLGTFENRVTGRHRWKAADGTVIYLPESDHRGWIQWTLRNYQRDSVPDYSNGECTASGVPDACCTGEGTGTCDDLVDVQNGDCTADGLVGTQAVSCCTAEDVGVCRGWSDTALFSCGSSACDNYIIGVGLRTLIMNQWKKLYAPNSTITF